MSKYLISRAAQQAENTAPRKSETHYSKLRLANQQVLERKSSDHQINPYLAEMDVRPTEKKRKQVDTGFNPPILIEQNKQLMAQNREMSLLIHEKNRTIEALQMKYTEKIEQQNKIFRQVEAEKQRFIGEVIKMKADSEARIAGLLHDMALLQQEKSVMERQLALDLKACTFKLDQEHKRDIDKLVQQYQQSATLASAETNKWKQQYEQKDNEMQIREMEYKRQSDGVVHEINKLKEDIKHLQQVKKLELAELKNFYENKLQKLHLDNRREKQLFLVEHDSQVKRSEDEVKRLRIEIEQITVKLQQKNLQLSTHKVEDINYRQKLQYEMENDLSDILTKTHFERSKYEQLCKAEVECLEVSSKKEVEHLLADYQRMSQVCELKNQEIRKLYLEMGQLREEHLAQLQSNEALIRELQFKLQSNQLLTSEENEIMKTKLGVLREADLSSFKSYYEHQIEVLTQRLHQKETTITLNRQKYQEELRKKAEMRKQFELKVAQQGERVKKLQIELSNLKAEGALGQSDDVVIMEVLQTKQVAEVKKRVKSESIKSDECRQLQLIINSKDTQIQELQNRILQLKGHHQSQIEQKDGEVLGWREKCELAQQQAKADKAHSQQELKKMKELLSRQKMEYQRHLDKLNQQRKKEMDGCQDELLKLKRQSEEQNRRFQKQEKQSSSKIQRLQQVISHKQREVVVFKEESHQTVVGQSKRERQLLEQHYNEQLRIKDEEILDLQQRISELSNDLRDSRENYSNLQKKLQQLIESQSVLREMERKVVNMGKENNLSKNMKEVFR